MSAYHVTLEIDSRFIEHEVETEEPDDVFGAIFQALDAFSVDYRLPIRGDGPETFSVSQREGNPVGIRIEEN